MSQRTVDGVGVAAQRRQRLDLSTQRKEIQPRTHVVGPDRKPGFRPVKVAKSRVEGPAYRRRPATTRVPALSLRQARTMDGVIVRPRRAAVAMPAESPATAQSRSKPHRRRRGHRAARVVGYSLAAVVAGVVIWLSIESLGFGEIAVGVYAAFVLIRRVSSRVTFYGALACLVGIVIAQIVSGGENWVGDNLAVYAFLLLAVGTISLGLEVRRQPGDSPDMAS